MAEQQVPEGYKHTEVGVIPEGWLVEPLENFTSFISYGFTNPMPTSSAGPFMVTARDINSGRVLYESARQTTVEAYKNLLSPKSRPKLNDILLTKDGTLGRLALVDKQGICINQSVALLRPNARIDPLYFKKLLESPNYQKKMIEDAGGSTIKHIYITIVNKMPVNVPASKEEQTAIANALSDVDALISSLEKLIAKKRAIKTAAMQQLLTGKKRLPPFDKTHTGYKQTELGEIPEDWDIREVQEVAKVKGGKRLPKGEQLLSSPTKHPYIRVADMYSGGVELSDIRYVPEDVAPIIKNYCIKLSDIFISVAGSLGIVGKIPDSLDGANLTENADRITDICVNRDYLMYWLMSKKIQAEIESQSTVGAQPKLALGRIEAFQIAFPRKLEEQAAIAQMLIDIEKEVTALDDRLTKTQQLKQGMMQELLMGRTRLV